MGRNIVCLAVLVSGMILTTSRTYENAAAGKSSSASQSSTDGNYSAALALDGNEDQAFTSCSNTQEENKPWWQVDLGKDYIVFAVRIWNVNHVPGDRVTTCRKTKKGEEYRGTINSTENGYTCEDWSDHPKKLNVPSGSVNYCRNPDDGREPWCYCNSSHCPKKEGAYFDYCDIPMCGERLSNFTISLDGHLCHHYTGTVANGASPEIGCDTPVIGRILKIQLFNYTFLTLCEVSVRRFQYQETPTVSVYGSSTPTSISVQWSNGVPIDSTSDIVIKYYVVYQQLPMASQTQQSPAIGKGMMNTTISDLQPSTEYSIGLKIKYSFNGRVFNSSQGQMTTFRTDSCENYMITPVLTVEGNAIDTSLKRPNRAFLTTKTQVTGMLPACIWDFDIYYKATRDTSFKRTRNTAPSNEIQNLIPFTEYDVIPSVVSPDGKVRNGTSTKIITAEDAPPAPSVIDTEVGPFSISVRVIPPNPSYGVITKYSLEMSEHNGESRTVYLGPTDTTFTFNDLKFETQYVFSAQAFTSKGAGNWSEYISIETVERTMLSTGQEAGLAVGILIALAALIAVAVIIYRRRLRGNQPPDTKPFNEEIHDIMRTKEHTMENVYEALVPTPETSTAAEEESDPEHCIFISNLISYVKTIRGERAEEFTQEFESLPKNIVKPVQQATSVANLPLNRYKNIVAYDHSRVILQPVGEEKSDYINATFIHGYQEENIFIASQGPLSSTIPAMWRMIWQERCPTVVMLTNLNEMGKPKCEQYWPDTGRTTYGPFTVQLAEEYKFTDYVKRILTVTLNAEVHTVKHFHFTTWPDHHVPKFACSLLNFRRQVFLETEYGKSPIVVHCSAGAGRTGTFIGIDFLIRQGKAENKVNFYECVRKMREQRANMVQNIGQYTHLHDAVLEFFKVGITNIQSSFYPEEYLNLIKPSPNKPTCRLQQQYSMLAIFTDAIGITPSEKAICHSVKNRNQDIVPEDKSRVVLSLPVNDWNDYVNAVYASGYGEKDTYIITQMPLPETVKDIWRIVHDTGVSTIVMMNLVDYEHSTVYWPVELTPLEFGPLVVEGLTTDASNGDITVRDFRILKKAKGNENGMNGRLVRHFQLQNWPDGQATPSSPESIVELLEMVEKWQQKVENKKILVHCLDGASQSGVFCVAHSVIEKVKVDHEVDVFQYLRLLRSNRPQLVNTYEQYKFIHEVVLEYLQGFDTYANFQ